MKKISTNKGVASILLLFFTGLLFSCTQKSFPPGNNAVEDVKVEISDDNTENYTPAPVITIPDEKAKTNKEGELYYDDEYGYRYWKFSDGKYYLDHKYENGKQPKKKAANKKKEKQEAADLVKENF